MELCPHQLWHNKLGQGTLDLRVTVVVLASRCGLLTETGAQESKESGRFRSPRDSTVTVSTRPGNERMIASHDLVAALIGTVVSQKLCAVAPEHDDIDD